MTSVMALASWAIRIRAAAPVDCRIASSACAIEAAPALETADIICDLTSSGVTLRENRLKMIAGGNVLESQACLIGNRRGLLADPERLEATHGLLELMEAYLRSRQQVSITANIRGESAEAVARRALANGASRACAARRWLACFRKMSPRTTGLH